MEIKAKTKKIILEIICFLLVLLFFYAALSKLFAFSDFQKQLAGSPIVKDYSYLVAWSIPTIEILISLMIIIPKFRMLGLFAFFSLMVMFTTYLILVLNFVDKKDIPCACGGVISNLGWRNHIYFNLFFIGIAVIGIIIFNAQKRKQILSMG
ncbi:MauE/DoxX family redox-associated membrane protein [Flavivirga jejuensis]|uniref:MauE/DoxX family redox-associated membrane protein n=1 Tax=Flavivirga jejuensis TaxID=870487 RepID=A0ABT8WRA6_9FLAO|nr:MauE/DoxX family redox-associated membrane protein [Flavivirga jejuensis]MDO5975722.1 MauE/DoxX family redox-associated membrane protein [Flavivirga jejuensis]